MKKKQSKRLTLAKETLKGLEKLVHGGTDYPSYPNCGVSDPINGCGTTKGSLDSVATYR
jgi:hypothetical protein